MLRLTRFQLFRSGLVAISLLLAACATQSPPSVPVIERTPSTTLATPSQAGEGQPAEPRPAYYTVKRGDTLISIALQSGQDYKDIALWNNLESPYVIYVGQVLHILPPEGAIALPVGNAPASAPANVPSSNTTAFKIEPQGTKRPYSDAALAELSKSDSTAIVTGAVPPVSKPEPPKVDTEVSDANLGWIWPASGKVTQEYSEARNKGVSIAGKMGDPVLAAADGKALYVGSGIRGYGNLVIIKHNSNFVSVYAHNSNILVKEEQVIKKGQKIAEMGNSDVDTKEVLLHFEIRSQGKPVDPLKYLPSR